MKSPVATGAAVAAAGACAYWTMMSPYSQLVGPFPYRGPADMRTVALTFDDGPNEPYTSRLADALAEHQAKATFFQVGACVERHPEVTARLAADGHVIASHGYAHQFHRCWTRPALRRDLTRAGATFTRYLPRPPALYRPPWLLRVPGLPAILRDARLTAVSGEFCHLLEVAQPSPRRIVERVLRVVRPGSILIFHDGFDARGGNRANTVAAVGRLLTALPADGYRLVTVDQMLGIPAYQ
jgi:peptidoglycan-N-acetylglucosamine deacetylase